MKKENTKQCQYSMELHNVISARRLNFWGANLYIKDRWHGKHMPGCLRVRTIK